MWREVWERQAGLVSSLESYFKSMAHGLIWFFFFQATLETLDWTQCTFLLVSAKKVSILSDLCQKKNQTRNYARSQRSQSRALGSSSK